MSSSTMTDLNTIELIDDIQHLLFLCDRLSTRLVQVTTYVDEIKQAWMNKRRSIETDSNPSPIVAQKVAKCNKVLLDVAEKLTVVELQTESLHTLHSSTLANVEKCQVRPPTPTFNHPPKQPSPSGQAVPLLGQIKSEISGVGFRLARDLPPPTVRPLTEQQRLGVNFQNPVNTNTNSFTARNTSSLLFNETPSSSKSQIDQQQSAFHRPISVQENGTGQQQSKLSSQNLLVSQVPPPPPVTPFNAQKVVQNGLVNGYQQPSSIVSTRSSTLSEPYSPATLTDSNTISGKVRVKMQVIPANTIWHNADVPIVDHPSAFFVSNQDPRVAEQFSMMSMEMNAYYSKAVNTTVPLQNVAIGDFCVARFSEDNLWYRARVVLQNSTESVLIVFIDYGNSESKPANEIYALLESLARLPAMTVACTLADSFPRNDNFWGQDATDAFNSLVKNRIVEVQFQHGSINQWPLHFVKIMLDGQSITQHPQLASFISPARNEQIALHFNEKLTSMEYILYNVAVVESDIYTGTLQ